MRIISKFKDYYDHVAYIGGPDPRVIYERKPFDTDLIVEHEVSRFPYYWTKQGGYEFKWLVIAGRYWLLLRKGWEQKPFALLSEEEFPQFCSSCYDICMHGVEYFLGRYDHRLVTLSRAIRAPVFIINSINRKQGTLVVEKQIPKLSEYPITKLISAEQMFQYIAYFMGNTLNVSPDVAPPVEIADKYKIEQAGFDLKTSFRHPPRSVK